MVAFAEALESLRRYPCPVARVVRQNFSLDARLSPERRGPYDGGFRSGGERLLRAVNGHHRRYLEARIFLPSDGGHGPETFDPSLNGGAIIHTPYQKQYLVRVEGLDWVLNNNALKLTRAALLKYQPAVALAPEKRPEDATTFFTALTSYWNTKRDQRPMFAAFAGEVEEDIKSDDWLPRLRSRLGLGHITPLPGGSLYVALMRYSVADVVKAVPRAEWDACFAVPTVLDGPFNPYFFPAPAALPFGRALNLQPDPGCARLTAEVLHRRIDYRPEHLYRIAEVRAVDPEVDLVGRRNQHLGCLRQQPGCAGFGEEMV